VPRTATVPNHPVSDKSLVIVESPAKAKTISAFLGPDYVVESSIGHIRDLPKSASDIPPKLKKEAWARLGVDVDNDFKPLYVIDEDKKAHIKRLKDLLARADTLYLATDEDREGESIAWHLLEVLEPKVPVRRMAFHEITKKAILEAIQHPREIDQRLVDAQEARRILDRLYGYEVSPVLWKKVMPKLSAGRVQSVSTRIIVERELARMRFVAAGYWDIEGQFETKAGEKFPATLVSVDGKRIATGKDFDDTGSLGNSGAFVLAEAPARALADALLKSSFSVASVEQKPNRRSPAPPFMTSTLQQEAGRKLRFSSSRTMRAAQDLYEAGLITYMRTDSTTLSETALNAARTLIKELYGDEYLPKSPRVYANKVKNAQEAHEAIRPAGDRFKSLDEVERLVGSDQAKLYELIWKRTVASQMEDARGQSVKVTLVATADGKRCEFTVTGNTITFPGFLRAYVEGSDDPTQELEQRERHLPVVAQGDALRGNEFEPKGHETQPPARFTEASLVKRLEELGVGRPSTYASIISTIQARGYVWKKGSALVPSFKAFSVIQLLEKHFADLVDYEFTARMEDDLDSIAAGREESLPWLQRFYFGSELPAKPGSKPRNANGKGGDGKGGNGKPPGLGLRSMVAERLNEIDARAINSLFLGRDKDGVDIIVRVGRYGPYLSRGDQTASLPEDLPPDELTVSKAEEMLSAPSGDRELGTDPASGLPVYVRAGRFGAYVQLGEAGGKEKPRTASLLKSMTPATATLEDAIKMLSLPRTVGNDDAGVPITAQLGRYGPYISCGKESRSLEREEEVFEVTVEQAKALLAQPKARGRRKAAEPLKELGNDGVSGQLITLRQGRFGLYVTDGETNASLRNDDTLENITPERSMELLASRRERGPVKKKKVSKKKGAATAAPAAAKLESKPAGKKASKAKPEPAEALEKAPVKAAPKKVVAKKAAAKSSVKAKPAAKSPKAAPAKKAAPTNGAKGAKPVKSGKGKGSSAREADAE
jgi:DNA topoisomerase-1